MLEHSSSLSVCSNEATHFAVIKFPRAAFDNSVLNLSAAIAGEAGWSLGALRDIYTKFVVIVLVLGVATSHQPFRVESKCLISRNSRFVDCPSIRKAIEEWLSSRHFPICICPSRRDSPALEIPLLKR